MSIHIDEADAVGIVRYFLNEHGLPRYEAHDERYWKLGIWITMEIGGNFAAALEALDAVFQVLEGSGEATGWEGESMDVRFTPKELILTDYDTSTASYPMAVVRIELERYWKFLLTLTPGPGVVRGFRPDLTESEASLLQWEEARGRRHPYRGRIEGIPAQGPT